MSTTQFYQMPDGRKLAFEHVPYFNAAFVFLPGYMSDKTGTKAQAVALDCEVLLYEYLAIDYTGCGESDGSFADGTLSRWRDEVLEVISAKIECEKIVLIGSSMGGWLMLLVGMALGDRLAGMIGVAAAPDFSDWGYSEDQKAKLRAGETIYEENPYGPEPTPTYSKFWRDAETHKLLDSTIPLTCPVRLLHGSNDTEVPPEISWRLAKALASEDVTVTIVEGGDHRLSREEDIHLLMKAVDDFQRVLF
ncbi:MAG: alpha/beta hydrolase [Erythrobacter sp.]|nr:MAG: alpha/beta hydrolase [Erythrobacter sp.]